MNLYDRVKIDALLLSITPDKLNIALVMRLIHFCIFQTNQWNAEGMNLFISTTNVAEGAYA